MPTLPALMPLTEADYAAIESAVMETNRGRWFLAEFAKRNRHADTTILLAAIGRIEATIHGERAAETDRIRFDLVEMAKAIARTKAEIAAIKPDADHHGKFAQATEELDSIVSVTETATSDILAAAEQIQEIGWTLREQGLEAEVCDLIDAKATEVYTACSFQDLTGQRSRKVIQVLRYLEGRINAMIGIWGLDHAMAAEAAQTAKAREGEAALLNDAPRPAHGLDQADIDVVMGPATASDADRTDDGIAVAPLPVTDAEPSTTLAAPEAAADPTPSLARLSTAPLTRYRPPLEEAPALAPAQSPPSAPEAPVADHPKVSAHGSPSLRREAQPQPDTTYAAHDPLAPIMALSAEEKIALFS